MQVIGEGDWPRCPHTFDLWAMDLMCDLPKGHPGPHRDPLEGVEWEIRYTPPGEET